MSHKAEDFVLVPIRGLLDIIFHVEKHTYSHTDWKVDVLDPIRQWLLPVKDQVEAMLAAPSLPNPGQERGAGTQLRDLCELENPPRPEMTTTEIAPDSDAGTTPETSAQFAKLEGLDTRSVSAFWFHETRVLMCTLERKLTEAQHYWTLWYDECIDADVRLTESERLRAELRAALEELVNIDEERGGLYAKETATSDLVLAMDQAKAALAQEKP